MSLARLSRSALLLLLGLASCDEDVSGTHKGDGGGPETEATEKEATDADEAEESVEETKVEPKAAGSTSNLAVWPGELSESTAGDRIYSKVRFLWIRPQPRNSGAWLGYLSLGDGIRVKGGDAKKAFVRKGHAKGCSDWYEVEPVGFVCVGEHATLDAEDPAVVALRSHAADRSSPWPYHYGESLQVPVYHRLPDAKKQFYREMGLPRHLEKVTAAKTQSPEERDEGLLGVDLSPGQEDVPEPLELPPGGRALQTQVVLGSTLAYVRRFQHEDRTFLMTWDRGFVPADKVKPYPRSDFHGVAIGQGGEALPIAWFREKPRPKLTRADGDFVESGAHWPRLAHVGLTGAEETVEGERYLETRDAGHWLRASDAVVTALSDDPPPQIRQAEDGHRTWLDISVLDGTLVAYENRTPVYATLISPGRGGLPRRGIPTLDTASTPTGVFSVLAKLVTATMVSGSISTLVHAEVQYTQNFNGPYALHGAYWHDRWGEKKSGGCINLAPRDAQRVFEWTHPRLPEGWHAMRSIVRGANWDTPTLLYVHR